MSSADSNSYDIHFSGECLEGHAVADVRAAVGKLFKADDKTLDRLFSGHRQRIKRGCDQSTAQRYQKAMAAAGARAIITESGAEPGAGTPGPAADTMATERSADPSTAASSDAGVVADALSLAPTGSDVLRPDERKVARAVTVDLDHLSLAAVGVDLGIAGEARLATVEAPSLNIAPVGTDLDQRIETPVSDLPDTSAIDLSPAQHDLSDCRPPAPAPVEVTLDGLSLAEAGDELLSGVERESPQATAPDTSHLTLDPQPGSRDSVSRDSNSQDRTSRDRNSRDHE